MKVVRHAFQQAYKTFANSLAPGPLSLCVDLAAQYGFATVAQSNQEGKSTDFVAKELVPTLKLLCQQAAKASTELVEVVTKFAPFFSSALSSCSEEKAKQEGDQNLWDEILTALASASPEKGNLTATFLLAGGRFAAQTPRSVGTPCTRRNDAGASREVHAVQGWRSLQLCARAPGKACGRFAFGV